MTTRVTTNEVQVLKRTWADLDPKVRNALNVWAVTVALGIAGLATKSLTPLDALCLLIPVTLAVITAYSTTSKHKDLILEIVNEADKALHSSSPALERATPQAGPAIALATAAADAIKQAVDTPDVTSNSASFTQVNSADEQNETQVLPSRAASILRAISNTGSNGPAPIVADGH